ncbi:di-trans,poly-cis-decaprenylcistransferase [Candidatus Gottesmanbacteria bacterium]|nr:di-trans,poly-cis-decaprenylcistransferase [Candidatus Gottesmanbacteria bacterium]
MRQSEARVPMHIAIIMDGNRRWAREHHLPVLAGHRKVIDDVLEPLIERAAKRGIHYMTFWAWSTENWKRDKQEVEGVMRLFKGVLRSRGNRLHERGVRVRIIGDISKFDTQLRTLLTELVEKTQYNTKITAIFALNYGGRDELLRAIRNLQIYKSTNKQMNDKKWFNEKIRQQELEQFLDTAGIPEPELIVRTGGEQRLSGFLLWQSEYSELYFPSWYMPEFTPERLDEAIEEFQQRKRRFGR